MVIQLFIGTSTRQKVEEERGCELLSTHLWSGGTIPASSCTARAFFSSCCKVELLLTGNGSYAIQVQKLT